MKGIKIIFAVCLALLGISDAWATDSDDAVRAATRRGETNTVTSARKKTNTPAVSSNVNAVTRVTNATAKQAQTMRERATTPRTGNDVLTRTSTPQNNKQVSARTATNISSRATTTDGTKKTTTSRHASPARTATRTPTTTIRTSTAARNASRRTSIARSATTDTANLRDVVMNANHKECRDVFYNCMDEFCANKDSQLKRCACSSRLHEFDGIKKQLAVVEDKMLDFSQRLLTVSMDAEDAAALNIATEGELAFNQKDTSESKKLLDEIAKKLNTKFDDDSFDRNLTAISLSLNEDAAFDNVDSLMGASTTLKTGTELHAAALPVCREMAAEVCTPDQLAIAESGYKMMIEQDCNTVKKSYQSQTDAARTKVMESSALLDMSRLNTYQDRNSDDILTCKRKMLDMLSDTSVCGKNLAKCLDTTGQYINPSTGDAFLTTNLANLSTLIKRPDANNTWTSMPGNERFVQHLNSKKAYLEPAMEHCQDIADSVWDDFIEDALAQIKLAQDAKLEEVRQSCTTLTTQCLSDTAKSLTDFDARALSTFGVIADMTVNAMCADVKTACTALLETTGGGTDWAGGMTEIATNTTYETIIQTCREVGRACIVQNCRSISGNFGLCENIETSVNRKAIIRGTSCWDDVLKCVADAGADSIEKITAQLSSRKIIPGPENIINDGDEIISTTTPLYSFYSELYDITIDGKKYAALSSDISGNGYDIANCRISGVTVTDDNGNETTYEPMRCVYDMCVAKGQCATTYNDTSTKCKTCRIAERIWGNCEMDPITQLPGADEHNQILAPSNRDETTLLYWFALNTGTENMADSCRDTSCGPGETFSTTKNQCISVEAISNDGTECESRNRIAVPGAQTNCCSATSKDTWGNCCGGVLKTQIAKFDASITDSYFATLDKTQTTNNNYKICIPSETQINFVVQFAPSDTTYYMLGRNILVCLGDLSDGGDTSGAFPSGDTIECDGQYMVINLDSGMYYAPTPSAPSPNMSYKIDNGSTTCTLGYDTSTNTWTWTQSGTGETSCTTSMPSANDGWGLMIQYQDTK